MFFFFLHFFINFNYDFTLVLKTYSKNVVKYRCCGLKNIIIWHDTSNVGKNCQGIFCYDDDDL